MWQGTGSTTKWNLSCYSTRVPAVLFGFSLIFFWGGGSTAASVTLDSVADESRKMADGVARSTSRLCSRDGEDLLLWRRHEYHFLACFCALFFVFPFFSYIFPASRYVYFPRVPSSVQHPSGTLSKYVFYSTCSSCLCHVYPTLSRNCFVFIRLFFS